MTGSEIAAEAISRSDVILARNDGSGLLQNPKTNRCRAGIDVNAHILAQCLNAREVAARRRLAGSAKAEAVAALELCLCVLNAQRIDAVVRRHVAVRAIVEHRCPRFFDKGERTLAALGKKIIDLGEARRLRLVAGSGYE